MFNALKPYPIYKDSGVLWLGNIPSQWHCHSLSTISRLRTERNPGSLGLLSVFLDRGVIPYEQGGGQVHAPSLDLSNYQVVRAGDLVLNNQQAWRGSVGISNYNGIISPAYVVLELSKRLVPEFANYTFRSPALVGQFVVASRGVGDIQRQLHMPSLRVVKVLVPPFPEQSAIVRFLSHADRRIQRYIRTKKSLIGLLNEQKQAIIHRVVTRGLDPNVRLKPSGMEWLGDVPEHWRVWRAKELFREVDERSETGTELLLSLRMYQGLVPHNEVSSVPIEPTSLLGFKRVAPGQLVMNRMRAAIGMFGIATQPGLVSPDYAVLEPKGTVGTAYYLLLFKTRAAGGVFRLESKGLGTGSAGFMRLYTDRFGTIKLPVPPPEEQRSIVAGVAIETAAIESTIARIGREIALLGEYRTRLIADVVTGKLDVREAAARLPDEAEEPEPLDEGEAMGEDKAESDDADLDAVSEESVT